MGIRATLIFTAAVVLSGCGRDPDTVVRDAGLNAHEHGDLIGAVTRLRDVLARMPDDSAVRARLADAYARGNWIEEGFDFFGVQRASTDGGRADELYYRAYFAARMGEADSADAALDRASAIRPPSHEQAIMLVEALEQVGLTDRALNLASATAARHPDEPAAHLRRTQLLLRADRVEEARIAGDTLLQLFPLHPGALALNARIAIMSNDLDRAERLAREWMRLEPDNTEARWALARVALRSGRLDVVESVVPSLVASGE